MKNMVNYSKRLKGLVIESSDVMSHWFKRILNQVEYKDYHIELVFMEDYQKAKVYIENNNDVSVIILNKDIDGYNSGLDLVKYIREDLARDLTRILIMVNHKSEADDTEIMVHYDVESILDISEISAQDMKLHLLSAYRIYFDLLRIDTMKNRFKEVVNFSENLHQSDSNFVFYQNAVDNIKSFFEQELHGFLTHEIDDQQVIVFGLGKYNALVGHTIQEVGIKGVDELKTSPNYYYYKHPDFIHNGCVVIEGINLFRPEDVEMIELYTQHISLIYNTMSLKQELYETQKEIIMTLGEVIETKSNETAGHVKRVAEFAGLFSKYLNLSMKERELIKLVAPMHDIGKIGISEAILNKSSKLTRKEFEIIKRHTLIGWKILAKSEKRSFHLAATIALEHHERWDGKGYPYGKQGEEINIASRIVAASDVIDALSHRRVYKEAWQMEEVRDYMIAESGKSMEPAIVKIFVEHFEEFCAILRKFPDE